MSTTTPVTAEQLLAMALDDCRCELVEGELRMMSPAGWKHGVIAGRLHALLVAHVNAHQLGHLFGAETGFILARDPDTVRAPDIAFIPREHLPEVDPDEGFWPGAPDLAVEVLSPGDQKNAVAEKVQAWLQAGSSMVWVVNIFNETVTVHRPGGDVKTFAAADTLDGAELLPGLRLRVAEIFNLH